MSKVLAAADSTHSISLAMSTFVLVAVYISVHQYNHAQTLAENKDLKPSNILEDAVNL